MVEYGVLMSITSPDQYLHVLEVNSLTISWKISSLTGSEDGMGTGGVLWQKKFEAFIGSLSEAPQFHLATLKVEFLLPSEGYQQQSLESGELNAQTRLLRNSRGLACPPPQCVFVFFHKKQFKEIGRECCH